MAQGTRHTMTKASPESASGGVLNGVKAPLRWEAERATERGHPAAVSAAIAKVRGAIEEELFQWEEVSIELPDSAFTNTRHSASYNAPQEGQLSPQEDSPKQKPEDKRYALFPELSSHKREACECLELGGAQLSPDQLESIWRTGSFEVASERYPGKVHKWRVNPLIAEGLDNLKEHFAHRCASALQHVRYGIVDRLIDLNDVSLLHAVNRSGNSVTSATDALIGIPTFHHLAQTTELAKAKARFLVQDFYDAIAAEAVEYEEHLSARPAQQECDFYHDEARGVYPANDEYGDSVPSALDLRLWLRKDSYATSIRHSAVQPLLDQIQREVPQRSREIVDDFIATGGAAEEGLSEEEALSRVQTHCQAVLMREVEERLAELDVFSSASGSALLERIVAALKVNIMRDAVADEVERERLTITSQVREKLQEEHVMLSKMARWLASETDSEMRRMLGIDIPLEQHWNLVLERRLIEGLEALHDPRLAQDIFLLKRGLQWEEEHAEAAAVELGEESKVPGYQRTFKRWWWDGKINNMWCPMEGSDIPVSSSYYGWRLHKLGAGTIDFTSLIAITSLNIMLWSTFSVRALLLREEFKHPRAPSYKLSKPTYRSRLQAAFTRHKAAIARFESEPDTGMLGKGASRLYQRLFSGTVLCASLALTGLLFPPLCVTVILASGAVAVLSPVIAGGICLSVHGFGLVRSLVATVFNVAVVSPLEAAVSVLGAAVYHPMCAALLPPLAVTQFSFGYLYYSLCQTVIGFFGKVPHADSFAAKRVAGPGLSFKTYKKSSLPAALAVVRVKLEELELDLIEKTALQTARQPLTLFERTVKKIVQPFASSVTPHNRFIANESAVVSAMIESTCQKRRQELPIVVPAADPVRLEPEDYDTLIDVSTTLVQEFVEKRIFGDVFKDNELSIAEFWADHGLAAGSFEEMAKVLLVTGLGLHILQPLTEEDCSVELRVENVPGMERFLSLAMRTKETLSPLGTAGVTIKRAMKAKGPVCGGFATFPVDKNSQGLQPKELVAVKAPPKPPVARRGRPSQAEYEYEGLLKVRE